MVKTYIPPEQSETICPACGGLIKAPASSRSRRVQCPKCREVIVIESRLGNADGADALVPIPERSGAEDPQRLAAIEERLAALEAALIHTRVVSAAQGPVAASKKLLWLHTVPGCGPDFSPAQAEALVHNLGTVAPQEITIRAPAGDPVARERAVWFQAIFLRAGWKVRGPEEIAPELAGRVLSLAVPELPVAEDAAKTYLALRAAGFEPIPVLDPAGADSPGASALSLIIPPVKAGRASPEKFAGTA